MGWDQLAAELWTKIANECDSDSDSDDEVRALCSPEMPRHIRDSARPVLFRNIRFRAYNILDKFDFSDVDRNQYPSSLLEMQELSRQRFTELPLSPMARHVRGWNYVGHLPPHNGPDSDNEESTKKLFLRSYADAMWSLFRASLPLYMGLTSLIMANIVIDDEAVTALNTLDNLEMLRLINCIVSTTTKSLRSFDHLTEYLQQEANQTFRVELMMEVCPTLTILSISAGKDHYRELYSALEQCHLLKKLCVEFIEVDEEPFERPPPEAYLSITACPDLSEYTGPAYYAADIITGRPMHTIKLIQLPNHAEEYPGCIDWIREHFKKGTVPVEVFEIVQWPAAALTQATFPVLFHEFPHLVTLRISIVPYLLPEEVNLRDEVERARYEAWHYLNTLHLLSQPLPFKIPPTLRTLELLTDAYYQQHPIHTFDEVVEALRHSAHFANLHTLTVGATACSQTWWRAESGIWNLVMEGEGFDFNGEGFDIDGEGRDYPGDFEDNPNDQINQMDEENEFPEA